MNISGSLPFSILRAVNTMLRVFETVAEGGVIRLPTDVPSTAHCVVTVLDGDLDTLRKQSKMMLSDEKQRRISELLSKNRAGTLTLNETTELDALAEEFDAATLAKGQALAALAQLNGDSSAG
jgi:hypothetical protein